MNVLIFLYFLYHFVAECTNYLAQPTMENGRPIDFAYEVNIASKYNIIFMYIIVNKPKCK